MSLRLARGRTLILLGNPARDTGDSSVRSMNRRI
jgi:hypothetical protein